MDSRERWNYIVDRSEILRDQREDKIQREWEDYFSELFDYKKILNEIDSQRSVRIGVRERARPDIVLKRKDDDLFVVELKQYSLPFDEDRETQLITYLKQLTLSIGVLICQKIYLYHLEYAQGKVNRLSIPFEHDNEDGIRFVELFEKQNFSVKRVADYIHDRLQADSNVEAIKAEIAIDGFVEEIVFDYYASQNYSEEQIKEALKTFTFRIERNHETDSGTLPTSDTNASRPTIFRSSKRKSNFSFKALGIPVGAELLFIYDPTIKVVVANDKNLVLYKGEPCTLSGLSNRFCGKNATQGPAYFSYQGKTLKQMRDEMGV